ncbi:MAG TPA: DUF4445 domain-containing protein [Anaerolineae bacterium]|nr:DUF4445 domain-containing protein [Anaerolineae bacterium]
MLNNPTPSSDRVWISIRPHDLQIEVPAGTDLLTAAQRAGAHMVSLCGGAGSCASCIIRMLSGEVTAISALEEAALASLDLELGYRLACQTRALSDVEMEIPPRSLVASQRLQLEDQTSDVEPEPHIVALDIQLDSADLQDLRSDSTRLRQALLERNFSDAAFPLAVLRRLSHQLRDQDWSLRLAIRGKEIVAALPAESPLLGLAIDIGTTKLALYLLDLANGEILAKVGALNPQVDFGEDVVSRISYATSHEHGLEDLQSVLVDTLNTVLEDCCQDIGASPQHIVEAVVVGNTVMHHIFAGLPVHQLGVSPYVPAVSEALDIRAEQVGLSIAPGAHVYLPPNIAGYVGADHVSMLLASEAWVTQTNLLALDIGTNTEITLITNGRLYTCSCASGPAFEGAHIQDGMRAASGAIERVHIDEAGIHLQTIDDQPAVGICGSGILDAVAEFLGAGALDRNGGMVESHTLVRRREKKHEVLLLSAEHSGHGRDIVVTRRDVNEIQLAKAAIRAGLEILLHHAGVSHDAINEIIVAGAFGTYLDVRSAIRLGMFPDLPLSRFRQVGNAAGAGARQMLLAPSTRISAASFVDSIEYVELSAHPEFTSHYMQALFLESRLALS